MLRVSVHTRPCRSLGLQENTRGYANIARNSNAKRSKKILTVIISKRDDAYHSSLSKSKAPDRKIVQSKILKLHASVEFEVDATSMFDAL
jgi:hypothetical protein